MERRDNVGRWTHLNTSFYLLQSLSPYVKVQNLTVDTIYNVSVKVFTEKSHHLLSMCEVRTLSSRTYHPKTIPSESIILSNFTANENPKLLSAYVQWKPADGTYFAHIYCQLCIRLHTNYVRLDCVLAQILQFAAHFCGNRSRFASKFSKSHQNIQIKSNAPIDFPRYGLSLRNDFVWDNGESRE